MIRQEVLQQVAASQTQHLIYKLTRVKLFFLCKMDKVSDILAFIDAETPEVQQQEPKEEQPQKLPIEDGKTYKNTLSHIRKVKKTNIYPCIINVNNEAVIFNTPEELETYKKDITARRRAYNKQQQSDKIKSTKLDIDKLPDISDPEDLLTDDVDDSVKLMYKKTQAVGIQRKGDKPKRLPTTSKKDTSEIYEYLKANKALIKRLILSDSDEFEQLTNDNIEDEELREKALQHARNTINQDNTWTPEALQAFIRAEMKQKAGPGGLNPALFKRK